jgi:hypothetical protein
MPIRQNDLARVLQRATNRAERRAFRAQGKWTPLQQASPKPLFEAEIEERIAITVAVYKSRHRYRSDSLPALGASAT